MKRAAGHPPADLYPWAVWIGSRIVAVFKTMEGARAWVRGRPGAARMVIRERSLGARLKRKSSPGGDLGTYYGAVSRNRPGWGPKPRGGFPLAKKRRRQSGVPAASAVKHIRIIHKLPARDSRGRFVKRKRAR